MKYHNLIAFLFVLSLSFNIHAQGCSDPGFCTVGSMGDVSSHSEDSTGAKPKHSYRITQQFAVGEDDVLIIPSMLDVYLQLSKLIQFQIRGPIYIARKGEVKSVAIGDIFLINTLKVLDKEKHLLSANIGVKLPTNQANLTYNDSILPMVYQSSLGTFDLIIGISHSWKHSIGALSGSFGYQQPFKHINQNKAPETLEFRRKADILFKLDHVFNVKNKLDLGVGLLHIFHVKNDTRLNGLDLREEINGSKGSTLNITGLVNWRISKTFELGTSFGVPVVVRDARPDGLTRHFVVNPYVQFNF